MTQRWEFCDLIKRWPSSSRLKRRGELSLITKKLEKIWDARWRINFEVVPRLTLSPVVLSLTQCITGRSSIQTPIRRFSILTGFTLAIFSMKLNFLRLLRSCSRVITENGSSFEKPPKTLLTVAVLLSFVSLLCALIVYPSRSLTAWQNGEQMCYHKIIIFKLEPPFSLLERFVQLYSPPEFTY